MNKLKITIEGPPASGKTTIAKWIANMLWSNSMNFSVIDSDFKYAYDSKIIKPPLPNTVIEVVTKVNYELRNA